MSVGTAALEGPRFYRLARPRPGRRLSPVTVTLSAVGHLAVLALLVAFARFAATRMDQPKVYMVNLVPSLGQAAPTPSAPVEAVEATALPSPVQKTVPDTPPPRAPVQKSESDTRPGPAPSLPPTVPGRDSTLPPPALPPRLARSGEKESPMLTSERVQRPPVGPEPPPPQPVRSARVGMPPDHGSQSGDVPGSLTATKSSSVTLDVTDFPFTYYLQQLQLKVSERWVPAEGGAGHRAVVLFEVGRDGRIGAPRVEQSSGSTSYDLAALRAVTEANPFPPLPLEFSANSLRVHFGFEVSRP